MTILTLDSLELTSAFPQFLLYTCPLQTISFCAVLPSSPKVFGFVAQHHAANTCHCYLFQSKKFVSVSLTFTSNSSSPQSVSLLKCNLIMILQSHVLVSVIGDAFRVSKKEDSVRGGKDLLVEALRHKV